MEDRRKGYRMRRLKEGRIVFNGRNSVMSCIVRDATAEGARVTLGEAFRVPAEFEFTMNGVARQARRIWVRDNELGLAYGP